MVTEAHRATATTSLTRKHARAPWTAGHHQGRGLLRIDNLYEPANITIAHHINQAIKAYGVMRDMDYVVTQGEVLIVDEFTGRLMLGRRYNEGLHQAIEAKEGVKVEAESKTLATITFQNYFRMYDKLSGMTGTAKRRPPSSPTSTAGHRYDPDQPPHRPHRPRRRVYKTNGKYRAVIAAGRGVPRQGPARAGRYRFRGKEVRPCRCCAEHPLHHVLNAKNHEKEAEIVAQAGRSGAVTVATNMAGRGTDIMLGGNAEFMAKAKLRKSDG